VKCLFLGPVVLQYAPYSVVDESMNACLEIGIVGARDWREDVRVT
jgi:hypothetical protein